MTELFILFYRPACAHDPKFVLVRGEPRCLQCGSIYQSDSVDLYKVGVNQLKRGIQTLDEMKAARTREQS